MKSQLALLLTIGLAQIGASATENASMAEALTNVNKFINIVHGRQMAEGTNSKLLFRSRIMDEFTKNKQLSRKYSAERYREAREACVRGENLDKEAEAIVEEVGYHGPLLGSPRAEMTNLLDRLFDADNKVSCKSAIGGLNEMVQIHSETSDTSGIRLLLLILEEYCVNGRLN